MKFFGTVLIVAAALVAIGIVGARAQVQPGPNLTPNGLPYTYAPRQAYLGRPGGWYWGPRYAPAPPPPVAGPPVDFGAPPVPELPPGPPNALPPIGWVYGPYTTCGNPPECSIGAVAVQADGLNVRVAPNGPPVMALVNGTPIVPLGREGRWLLVAAACDLTPTFLWSWTAGVPLNRCWIP